MHGTTSLARKSKPAINYTKLAAQQPHRRWLPEDKRESPLADNMLGCLMLLGALDDDEERNLELYLAGARYAHAVGQYRTLIGGPRSTAGQGKGYDCNATQCEDHFGPPENICECFRRRGRYTQLHDALVNCVPLKPRESRHCVAIVIHVVVHGFAVGDDRDLRRLRTGLGAIASYLLTESRKSGHRKSTH